MVVEKYDVSQLPGNIKEAIGERPLVQLSLAIDDGEGRMEQSQCISNCINTIAFKGIINGTSAILGLYVSALFYYCVR